MGQLTCKHCAQTFERPVVLRSHLQQAHARHKYFCSICLETTPNRTLMDQHQLSRHGIEYHLINGQPEFLELPAQPEEQQQGANQEQFRCWVSAVKLPFGKKQMDEFRSQLMDEWLQRRQGRKTTYRPSELRLLPRKMIFSQRLQCAECEFKSISYKELYGHLLAHKEAALRLAMLSEQSGQLATTSVPPECPTGATPSVTQSSTECRIRNFPYVPNREYVPQSKRFVCCMEDCNAHLPTELELRQHFATTHSYSQSLRCAHCYNTLNTVEAYLDHLLYHKRHIYQCGRCETFHPRRSGIERHINARHGSNLINVLIHKRSGNSDPDEIRWLQSSKYGSLLRFVVRC